MDEIWSKKQINTNLERSRRDLFNWRLKCRWDELPDFPHFANVMLHRDATTPFYVYPSIAGGFIFFNLGGERRLPLPRGGPLREGYKGKGPAAHDVLASGPGCGLASIPGCCLPKRPRRRRAGEGFKAGRATPPPCLRRGVRPSVVLRRPCRCLLMIRCRLRRCRRPDTARSGCRRIRVVADTATL